MFGPRKISVKIIKSEKDTYWYANKINTVYDVVKIKHMMFGITYQCVDDEHKFISISDAIIWPKKEEIIII